MSTLIEHLSKFQTPKQQMGTLKKIQTQYSDDTDNVHPSSMVVTPESNPSHQHQSSTFPQMSSSSTTKSRNQNSSPLRSTSTSQQQQPLSSSPVITARSARSFWVTKEEKEVHSKYPQRKQPTTQKSQQPQRLSSGNSIESHYTANSATSGIISNCSSDIIHHHGESKARHNHDGSQHLQIQEEAFSFQKHMNTLTNLKSNILMSSSSSSSASHHHPIQSRPRSSNTQNFLPSFFSSPPQQQNPTTKTPITPSSSPPPTTTTFDNDASSSATVVELQNKLDIAAAQLLTNEMRTKDLHEMYQSKLDSLQLTIDKLQRSGGGNNNLSSSLKKHEEEKQNLIHQIQSMQENDTLKETELKNCREQISFLKEALEEAYKTTPNHNNNNNKENRNHHPNDDVEKNQQLVYTMTHQLRDKELELKKSHELITELKKELEALNFDLSDLADETERLEKELEVVQEDRDELLRRSIIPTTNSSICSNSMNDLDPEEVRRLRKKLTHVEDEMKKKDMTIRDLESMVSNQKAFDLDISCIDLDSESGCSPIKPKPPRQQQLQHSKDKKDYDVLYHKHTLLSKEVESLRVKLKAVTQERDGINICLTDAISDLERREKQLSSLKDLESYNQRLLQELSSREEEVVHLNQALKDKSTDNCDPNASLRGDLKAVVDWLDSSSEQQEGIECLIPDVGSYTDGNKTKSAVIIHDLNEEDLSQDNLIRSLYRLSKAMQMKLISSQTEVKRLNQALKQKHVKEEELRKSMKDSLALIQPMKDHVLQTEKENEQLRLRLDQVQGGLQSNRGSKVSQSSNRDDLSHDYDYVLDLIKNILDVLSSVEVELPTPQKSNRSMSKLSAGKSTAQSSNEEDDQLSRSVGLEVERMKDELEKKHDVEYSLRDILRESYDKLSIVYDEVKNICLESEDDKQKIAMLKNEKEDIKSEMKVMNNELLQSSETISRMQSEIEEMKQCARNKSSSNDDENETSDSLAAANKRIVELAAELSETKSSLKSKQKKVHKLEKSLDEAVSMLRQLQMHIKEAEKERKHLKKENQSMKKSFSALKNQNTGAVVSQESDKGHFHAVEEDTKEGRVRALQDYADSADLILHLKNHIIDMEQEIKDLEERIASHHGKINASFQNQDSAIGFNQDISMMSILQEKLDKAEEALEQTKRMLEDTCKTNSQLLQDLKDTENEVAETFIEMEQLEKKASILEKDIQDAKTMISSVLNESRVLGKGNYSQTQTPQTLQEYIHALELFCIFRINQSDNKRNEDSVNKRTPTSVKSSLSSSSSVSRSSSSRKKRDVDTVTF